MTEPLHLRLHQTHDASGSPAPGTYVVEVPDASWRATSESLLDAMRPFDPLETGRSGAYWYRDEGGTGWIEVIGATSGTLEQLDDAIRTLEIAARLDEDEVHRQPELGLGSLSVPRTTNPYALMAVGVGAIGLGGYTALRMIETDAGGMVYVVSFFAVALVALGVYIVIQGARRRSWWHRARAEAKRMKRPLPAHLKVWN